MTWLKNNLALQGWGLIILSALFLWLVFAPLAGDYWSLRQETFRHERQVAAFRARLGKLPETASGAQTHVVSLEFLPEHSILVQRHISELIRASGGRLGQMAAIPETDQTSLPALGITLSIEGDLQAMEEVLIGLGDSPGLLVIDQLEMRTLASGHRPETRLRMDLSLTSLPLSEVAQ